MEGDTAAGQANGDAKKLSAAQKKKLQLKQRKQRKKEERCATQWPLERQGARRGGPSHPRPPAHLSTDEPGPAAAATTAAFRHMLLLVR